MEFFKDCRQFGRTDIGRHVFNFFKPFMRRRVPDINCHKALGSIVFRCQGMYELPADIPASPGNQHGIVLAEWNTHAACASGSPGRGLLDQKVATLKPAIICHIPHHAATMAMPPRPSKKLKINMRPRAEF
jgi:hypothetical protein